MDNWILEYENRATIIGIAKKYKQRASAISSFLKSNGTKIRSGRTGSLGCKKYTLNHNYFSVIDNKEKAYLLGIMYSDGCVAFNSNTISLICNDLDLIEFFKSQIECDKELYKNKNHDKAITFSFVVRR